MRNVAISINQLRAKQHRAKERAELDGLALITDAQKKEKTDKIKVDMAAVKKAAATGRNLANKKDQPEAETKKQILAIDIEEDAALLTLQRRAEDADKIITVEMRAQRLQELAAEDAAFDSMYGVQPLSADDIAQKNADEIHHNEHIAAKKYQRNRQQEYPSIGDQLEAIWLELEHSGKMHPKSLAVLEKIKATKKKYPKRGKANA